MKDILLKLSIFVFGIFIGIIITSYVSMVSSSVFVKDIKNRYLLEQRINAIRAKEAGDYQKAALYYKNLIQAYSSPGLHCFREDRKVWTMSYPFYAYILDLLDIQSNSSEKMLGLYYAMLADVLEKSGDIEAAKIAFGNAASSLGCDNDRNKILSILQAVQRTNSNLLESGNKL